MKRARSGTTFRWAHPIVIDHALSEEDLVFQREFEAGIFKPENFNHRAHLRLAYVHLARHGVPAALPRFRNTLLTYLSHHGVSTHNYHATLTQAWLQAVWHFMVKGGATASAAEFLDRSPDLLDAKVMLTHYSREVLFSQLARESYIEPDIEPIPLHAQG